MCVHSGGGLSVVGSGLHLSSITARSYACSALIQKPNNNSFEEVVSRICRVPGQAIGAEISLPVYLFSSELAADVALQKLWNSQGFGYLQVRVLKVMQSHGTESVVRVRLAIVPMNGKSRVCRTYTYKCYHGGRKIDFFHQYLRHRHKWGSIVFIILGAIL